MSVTSAQPQPQPPRPPSSPTKKIVADSVKHPSDSAAVLTSLTECLAKYEKKTQNNKQFYMQLSDWQLITGLVSQLQKNHRRENEMFDSIAELTQAVASLSTKVCKRLDNIEDKLENDELPSSIQPLTYASAAGKAPATKSSIPAQPPSKGRNTELDTTLVQSNPSDPVYTLTLFPDLKKRIDTAISEAGVTRADGKIVSIRAVSRHASKDLIITAHTLEDMNLLRNKPWLTHFSEKLTIRKPIYAVIVHRIPTTFEPNKPEAIAELQDNNPGALTSLIKVMWANPKKALATGAEKKKHSSAVLHLEDPIQANNLMSRYCVFQGETHPTEKSRRSLLSCHKCANWGHTAARCLAPPSCARCAGKHLTINCNCTEPDATKCKDHHSCTHIITKCPNCDGNHRATAHECPARIKAQDRLDEINLREGPTFPISQ